MTEDIAIDLGTANTLITYQDKVVIDSPSIVAQDRRTGQIIAVGKEARQMHGKTHENIKTIRPLKDGVIADFEASEYMIRELIKSIPAFKKRLFPLAFAWSSVFLLELLKLRSVPFVTLLSMPTQKKYI